jgi:hypothetical protein
MKAGIVEQEQTSIARQRLSKHIPVATNEQTTIEELSFLCNGEVDRGIIGITMETMFSGGSPWSYINL